MFSILARRETDGDDRPTQDGWYFDYPEKGIEREALVGNVGALLELYIGTPHCRLVAVQFSDELFEGAQAFPFDRPENSGFIYRAPEMEFWLCDVLLQFFATPPAILYATTQLIT